MGASESCGHLCQQTSFYQPILDELEQLVFIDLPSSVIGAQILPESGFLEAVPGLAWVKAVACIDGQEIAKGQGDVLFVAATGFLFCAFVEQTGQVPKGDLLEGVCRKWPKHIVVND